MILLIAILTLGQPTGLDSIQNLAYSDLLAQQDQLNTRYISLHAAKDKQVLISNLIFALNSTSFRGIIINPTIIKNDKDEPVLLRINVHDLGWSKAARLTRLERFKSLGVEIKNFTEDFWEQLAQEDYYFFAPSEKNRGWLNPETNLKLRTLTYSSKPILNGYQTLNRLLNEPFYSQALLFPPKETDLYKVFGLNISFIDSDPTLKHGGATLDSEVALHNRELQLLPSLYGKSAKFIWRTFDFNKDTTGNRSVLENFAGTVVHDGREIIGSLPNGLHWYYLSNAKGDQVPVVPQDIAIDQRNDPKLRLKDRSVINAYKCISCHGPFNGIRPFFDVVSSNIKKPGIGLGIFNLPYYLQKNEQNKQDPELKARIEEYYLTPLEREMVAQQESYALALKLTNGLTSDINSDNINNMIEDYQYLLVSPEQAQLEMQVNDVDFRTMLRNSGNPYMILLSAKQPVRRSSFEEAFKDAMLVKSYPWENRISGTKVNGSTTIDDSKPKP